MGKTFDTRIKELEQEKSELDLNFLQTKKQEYQQRIIDILEKQTDGMENAEKELEEMRSYHKKIKETDYKIEHKDEILKKIDERIKTYKERKELIKATKSYRETEEGINEIIGGDPLYQYAKETNNKELIQKIEKRSLTIDAYNKFSEKMYKELFSSILKKKNKGTEIQATTKIEIPEGMTEKIEEILKDNKDFTVEELEDFLKKELKKNDGEIMTSHIRNKFKEREDIAIITIKKIITDFPKFKIIDNIEKKNETTTTPKSKNKHEKLLASINPNPQKGKETTKNQLLKELSKIGEEVILEKRIESYIKIFEKLGHKFSDKELFKKQTIESIETHSSIKIEEGLKNTLKKIIKGTLTLSKKNAFGYRAYELGQKYNNWRILLYPNKEIMKICSHTEYENTIDSRPPADKR